MASVVKFFEHLKTTLQWLSNVVSGAHFSLDWTKNHHTKWTKRVIISYLPTHYQLWVLSKKENTFKFINGCILLGKFAWPARKHEELFAFRLSPRSLPHLDKMAELKLWVCEVFIFQVIVGTAVLFGLKILFNEFLNLFFRELTVPFSTESEAQIVRNSLSVDPEPKRGGAKKQLTVKDNVLYV